jgi:hypothetical protein
MQKPSKQHLALIFFSTLLLAYNPAMARTDTEAQQSYLKARAKNHQQDETDHSAHTMKPADESEVFHGVFYGYFPCNDCDGIKMTLSLKQKNNYLLVTQPARDSSREFYEKGKYSWDDEKQIVVLTPRNEPTTRQFYIEDEGTLIQLNAMGPDTVVRPATLRRSDTVKSRSAYPD